MGWVNRRFDLPRQTQDCNIIALETDCNQYLVPETAGKYKLLLNVGAVGWITEGLTEPGAKTPPFAWYYVLWKNDDLPRQARDTTSKETLIEKRRSFRRRPRVQRAVHLPATDSS